LDSLKKPAKSSKAEKRARLFEAALALFETRGFDGVAVPEIAANAGVAVGTVYRYFATKEALVNALYRHWKSAYNKMVLAPVPEGLTPRETFSLYWRRMMLFVRNHPEAARFMDLHHHGPYLDEESRALARAYAEVAAAFVTEARTSGAIRDLDPVMVVALMSGAATGLVKFASQNALAFDQQTISAMEDTLWRAIATDPQANGDRHGTQA
jgi:AcrR family transcriptional regulator